MQLPSFFALLFRFLSCLVGAAATLSNPSFEPVFVHLDTQSCFLFSTSQNHICQVNTASPPTPLVLSHPFFFFFWLNLRFSRYFSFFFLCYYPDIEGVDIDERVFAGRAVLTTLTKKKKTSFHTPLFYRCAFPFFFFVSPFFFMLFVIERKKDP